MTRDEPKVPNVKQEKEEIQQKGAEKSPRRDTVQTAERELCRGEKTAQKGTSSGNM